MTDGRDNYFLGLPAWAFPGWRDRYFAQTPSMLASYSQVFDTVEGNTSFYRTPDAATVRRWQAAVAERRFRFCFKLPRGVTHEPKPDLNALGDFLDVIEPLAANLGPLLVQFPATFAPQALEEFTAVFDTIAQRYSFVVEVRHPAFFSEPERLEAVLVRYGAGRVILDSRPLFEGNRTHPEVLAALHEKPDVPVLPQTCNDMTLIRLILHPDIVSNDRYIAEWASRVAGYLTAGVRTWMMIHCPNNLHCPELAQTFHEALRRAAPALDLPALPPWPVPQQGDLLAQTPSS